MHCVTIVYPNKDGATFNFDYYLSHHMPMVAKLLGSDLEVRKGMAAPTGDRAPYVCICSVRINSVDEYVATMTKDGDGVDRRHPQLHEYRTGGAGR